MLVATQRKFMCFNTISNIGIIIYLVLEAYNF